MITFQIIITPVYRKPFASKTIPLPTGEITYLEDPEASKELMTEHQETLLARPEWVAGRHKSIEALVAACKREKIEVWVNVNLGGKDLRFRKMTK